MFRELEADGTPQRPFQIDDFAPSEIDRIRCMNSLLGRVFEQILVRQLLGLPEQKDDGEGAE